MDWLTFIAEMTKALAWPVALSAIVFAFRRYLAVLLGQLSSLKYDKIEMQFKKEMAAVEKRTEAELPAVPAKSEHEKMREQLLELAMRLPEAAVMEAWRYLEAQLYAAAEKRAVAVAPPVKAMPMVMASLLYKTSVISEAQHSLIQRLRVLRNEVAHSRSGFLDVERAVSFVESALRLASSLTRGD